MIEEEGGAKACVVTAAKSNVAVVTAIIARVGRSALRLRHREDDALCADSVAVTIAAL